MITVSVSLSVSVSVYSYTFRTTGCISSRILTKLGMMIGYGSGMMPIVGRSGPVIRTVPVHWFLPKNGVLYTFRTGESNSSSISTKLSMMNDYRSVRMHMHVI